MQNVIHKYPIIRSTLATEPHQFVSLPSGAKVLHVGEDPGGIDCLWAEVDLDQTEVAHRRVMDVFTGGEVPGGYTHVTTHVARLLVLHWYVEDE